MSSQQLTAFYELPDIILFNIASYLAAPTHRASVLCQFAALCKNAKQVILEEEERPLWDIVIKEDYGSVIVHGANSRRVSKRLRRSPIHRVRDAHRLIKDNTEIAFFYLSEMTTATSKSSLQRSKMCGIFEEYGPQLRFNNLTSTGGVFLVEVCRARHVKESVIRNCVEELIEHRGALVDIASNETVHSRQTALCVSAVRAMPSVVKYLLRKGASPSVLSSGRFRLHTNPKKSLRCIGVTPLDFCRAMRDAEIEVGASQQDLRGLEKCIRLLESC